MQSRVKKSSNHTLAYFVKMAYTPGLYELKRVIRMRHVHENHEHYINFLSAARCVSICLGFCPTRTT